MCIDTWACGAFILLGPPPRYAQRRLSSVLLPGETCMNLGRAQPRALTTPSNRLDKTYNSG